MKFKLLLLFLTCSLYSYAQCFDCSYSIGGHGEDYSVDLDKATDGIVLTINTTYGGWARNIRKYDFNCRLIWQNNFEPPSGSVDNLKFADTTLDDQNNVYASIKNSRGSVTIQGFTIEKGNSLLKLDANGTIQWVRKIGDGYIQKRKIHYANNTIYVAGQLNLGIPTDLGLTIENLGNQYFVAKFDLSGNLIKAEQYGTNEDETFYDSQIDEDGTIYITGLRSASPNQHTTEFLKINSELEVVWSREISNTFDNRPLRPMTIYYNSTNKKLYVWAKYFMDTHFYSNSVTVSNDCEVGSILMEISKSTGDLENYKVIDNCGFLFTVDNGISSVEQQSFMSHEGDYLYVLSTFRGEITIGNQTVRTSQTNVGDNNADLILYRIHLTDYTTELLLKSSGVQYYTTSPYYDVAGPITVQNENVYITATYMSSPMTINGNTITNNSGNNARDVLFYKYTANQEEANGILNYQNTCFQNPTLFDINGNFDAVEWNFGDPNAGVDNTSTATNPSHTFTAIGNYTVTALVTCGTDTETLSIEVSITDQPTVNQINDLYACEDQYGSRISSTFDTSSIESSLVGNLSNLSIKYFNQNGVALPSPLPNPMTNTVPGQETITAQIAYNNNLTCYTEIRFNLVTQALPKLNQVNNFYACDDDDDGLTSFDISTLRNSISDEQSGFLLELFYEDGQQVPNPLPNTLQNRVPYQETLTARVTNQNSTCYQESTFDIIVNPKPQAHSLPILRGCDDNNDGISEYFNTSQIESLVLNGQTGMSVSYFDQNGNQLPSPLQNPYTNTSPYLESLTVRVTDMNTMCYAETILELQTVTQPNINQPNAIYACDLGNGYADFNTLNIEQQLIGNQTGLHIRYFDEDNIPLPSPLPTLFRNTEPFSQTIRVRVEDAANPLCYSETSFDLVVNTIPEITLEDEYTMCNLEPSITLSVPTGYNSYRWTFEDGTTLSETPNAVLAEEGEYLVSVTQMNNGVVCENSFSFHLFRSELPTIQEVKWGDLGDNFIEISATGDGNFEYSIDGIHYQDQNYFSNIQGGLYTVHVRDKEGCGSDSKEVTIIDYPKFFTPNNDGYNDVWQIKGIASFPNSKIFIFDRYGKLITQLSAEDRGWNGLYNGKQMMSTDYWFKANLGNGRSFSGHFSLKR